MNNIAILGYGTVGKGVKELLDRNPLFHLAAIFDRIEKKKEVGALLVTDLNEVINDPTIDTVVECMGGDTISYLAIKESLKHHKNVVSSNKETISMHLKEYLELANANKVSLQFEASVGGGIPLLYPLTIQAQFDDITEIKGILNGTSNFILTKMQDEKMKKEEAIKLAQQKGFAEKDPTADLEGLDMVRKGSIIASLITQREIHNNDIPHFGISNVNADIIDKVASMNRIIKMVTDIKIDDEHLSVTIMPIAIKKDTFLAQVKYEYNGVLVEGKYQDPLTFIGKGAGKNPTASAILQDLIRINKKITYPYPNLLEYYSITPDLEGSYLVSKDYQIREVKNPSLDYLYSCDFVCRIE
jgi:homoserine dehydrogenase